MIFRFKSEHICLTSNRLFYSFRGLESQMMMKSENLVSLLIKLSPRTTEIFSGRITKKVSWPLCLEFSEIASLFFHQFWRNYFGHLSVVTSQCFDCFALRISNGIVLVSVQTAQTSYFGVLTVI